MDSLEHPSQADLIRALFGKNLAAILKEKGLTQQALAEHLNVNKTTVSAWIRGKAFPGTDLVAICNFLDTSADRLLEINTSDTTTKSSIEEGYDGFAWTQRYPDGRFIKDTDQQREYELGLRWFNALMKPGLKQEITNLTREHRTEVLNRAFLAAVRSGHLTVMQVKTWSPERVDAYKQKLTDMHMLDTRLDKVVVVDLPYPDPMPPIVTGELVTFLAATHEDTIGSIEEEVVGLGGGFLALRFCEQTRPGSHTFEDTTWVALLTEEDPAKSYTNHSANSVVSVMYNRHPASHSSRIIYPFSEEKRAAHDALFKAGTVTDDMPAYVKNVALKRWRSITRAYTAITALGPDQSQDFKVYDEIPPSMFQEVTNYLKTKSNLSPDVQSSDICAQYLGALFQKNGSQYHDENTDEILCGLFSIPLEIIRELIKNERPVFLIASGVYKADAVLSALRAGLANCLVIDSHLAEQLLTTK